MWTACDVQDSCQNKRVDGFGPNICCWGPSFSAIFFAPILSKTLVEASAWSHHSPWATKEAMEWYKFIEFFFGLSGSRRLLSAATRWCFLPVFRCNLHAERKGLKFKGLVLVELSNGACRNVAFFFWQQKKNLLWSQNGFKCCRGWCKAPSCSNLYETDEVWEKL